MPTRDSNASELNDEVVRLPDVTVVIPNHNYGQWVVEAMQSVAMQDYPNKKLVVVDDGSTDNSIDTILATLTDVAELNDNAHEGIKMFRGLCGGMPTFLVGNPEAKGPSFARNVGIKSLFGYTHIFGFLDADDYWRDGKISKSVAKFLEHPDAIGVVYTDNDTLNVQSGLLIREYREPFNRVRLLTHNMVHSGSFVSRLAFQNFGLYDEEMRTAEDYDLWIRISEGMVICHIPESLVVARVHGGNASSSVDMSVWQRNWQRIGQKLQARLNNPTNASQ